MNLQRDRGLNAEVLKERNARFIEGDHLFFLVAVADSSEVVAYARSTRRASEPAGQFSVDFVVHPSHERRGLGRRLYECVSNYAIEHGAGHLVGFVDDPSERGHRFAERNGFTCVQHLFESKLDLALVDMREFRPLEERLVSEGYTFTSMADFGDTLDNWKRLHELDSVTDLDTPGVENWGHRPFDRYYREMRETSGFMPEGIFVAEREGEWVALHMVSRHSLAGVMQTDYTGVRREHRGKGLAQALKARGVAFAKSTGATFLRTYNDERNAPMLAINAKFGFVVEPGFKTYRKDL